MICCAMTCLLCMGLGAGPASATLVIKHIVSRVAPISDELWSSQFGLKVSNCSANVGL
jgi:hypothetical protein